MVLSGRFQKKELENYYLVSILKTIIKWNAELQDIGESELDLLYSQGIKATLKEYYPTALDSFLQIVSNSRKYRDDGARKAMLTIFNILGDRHPLTLEYQQKLLKILY